jgi:hypothetical protein
VCILLDIFPPDIRWEQHRLKLDAKTFRSLSCMRAADKASYRDKERKGKIQSLRMAKSTTSKEEERKGFISPRETGQRNGSNLLLIVGKAG